MFALYYGGNVTHLATIVFLFQKNRPEDGRIIGRNMLVKTL